MAGQKFKIMSESEIARICSRIDRLEDNRAIELTKHEDVIREEMRSTRSTITWFVGIALVAVFGLFSWLSLSHMSLQVKVSEHRDALKIVIGKMNVEHPGYVIEDLDNSFNPMRGID